MSQEEQSTAQQQNTISQTSAAPPASSGSQPSVQVNVQNVVQQSAPASNPVIVINQDSDGPGLVVQLLWFLLVGWWLSQLAIWVGYILILSIIFMPFGIWILNRMPAIVALREQKQETTVTQEGGVISVKKKRREQRSIFLRLVYFLLIGWWFGFIVAELAWLVSVTIIGIPLGIWLFDRVPAVVSLQR